MRDMSEQAYIGSELEIFEKANNWKKYFSRFISPYLGQSTLEVGAGSGATTKILCSVAHKDWLCLEPDANLLIQIEEMIKKVELPSYCRTMKGVVADLGKKSKFNSIIYIDVLEHIEKDQEELTRASQQLTTGGRLIVLSPAYETLYSQFDHAIGHYRRYTKSSLSALTPQNCKISKLLYLDSVGVLLSFANRLMLRQSEPTDKQIQFWDEKIIPISRIMDKLIGYKMGRSIVCVWEKLAG